MQAAIGQIRKASTAYVIGSLLAAATGDEHTARQLYQQAEVYNPAVDEIC